MADWRHVGRQTGRQHGRVCFSTSQSGGPCTCPGCLAAWLSGYLAVPSITCSNEITARLPACPLAGFGYRGIHLKIAILAGHRLNPLGSFLAKPDRTRPGLLRRLFFFRLSFACVLILFIFYFPRSELTACPFKLHPLLMILN